MAPRPREPRFYHVEAAGFLYSVPHALIREQVDLRLTTRTVEVFHRGQRVAAHERRYGGSRHGTEPDHMPRAHRRYAEWHPSASGAGPARSAPRRRASSSRCSIIGPIPSRASGPALGVLRLFRGLDPARVEAVSARAVAVGALTYKSIASILANNLQRAPRPSVSAPLIDHPNLRGPRYFH